MGDIGFGQSILDSYIVVVMTSAVKSSRESRVIDVRTGRGYQTAELFRLVEQVVSIEIVPDLADLSRQRLADLGFANAQVVTCDAASNTIGGLFDAIVVVGGCAFIPPSLLERLALAGRLVRPIGPPKGAEKAVLAECMPADLQCACLGAGPFVSLTGKYGRSAAL